MDHCGFSPCFNGLDFYIIRLSWKNFFFFTFKMPFPRTSSLEFKKNPLLIQIPYHFHFYQTWSKQLEKVKNCVQIWFHLKTPTRKSQKTFCHVKKFCSIFKDSLSNTWKDYFEILEMLWAVTNEQLLYYDADGKNAGFFRFILRS